MRGCYQEAEADARRAQVELGVRGTMSFVSPAIGLVSLVVVTMIWGTTFVVVKGALDTISVPLLLARRFALAGLLLASAGWDRRALVPALTLGLLSFAGFVTQTIGLSITSASNAAFITGLSVILTPLVGRLFWRQSVAPRVFA